MSIANRVRTRIAIAQRQYALWSWRTEASLRARRIDVGSANGSFVASLQNALPNSGPFPVNPEGVAAESVLAAAAGDSGHRKTTVSGFEGFALDDALAYSDEYKHFSYFREAKAIARIAEREFGRTAVSFLELGCGGGDLHAFLRLFGLRDYLGVDANPIAFHASPYIRPFPGHFRLLNLQEEIDFRSKFDMVCTFEVLEHIREDMLDGLLRTVRNHMGPTSLFLGTASLQEEYDVHITVRPRPFWIAKFAEHGLVPHERSSEHEELLSRHHPFNWEASNTNVFSLRLRPQ